MPSGEGCQWFYTSNAEKLLYRWLLKAQEYSIDPFRSYNNYDLNRNYHNVLIDIGNEMDTFILLDKKTDIPSKDIEKPEPENEHQLQTL